MHHQLTWKQLMMQQANKGKEWSSRRPTGTLHTGSIPLQSARARARVRWAYKGVASWPHPSLSPRQPPSACCFPPLYSSELACCHDNRQTLLEGFPRRQDRGGSCPVGPDCPPPPPSVCSELRLGPSSSLPPAGRGGGVGVLLFPHSSSFHPLFDLFFHLFLILLHFFDVPTVNTRSHQSKTSLWLDTVATATQPGAQDRKHVSRWRWVAQDASGGDRWRC